MSALSYVGSLCCSLLCVRPGQMARIRKFNAETNRYNVHLLAAQWERKQLCVRPSNVSIHSGSGGPSSLALALSSMVLLRDPKKRERVAREELAPPSALLYWRLTALQVRTQRSIVCVFLNLANARAQRSTVCRQAAAPHNHT